MPMRRPLIDGWKQNSNSPPQLHQRISATTQIRLDKNIARTPLVPGRLQDPRKNIARTPLVPGRLQDPHLAAAEMRHDKSTTIRLHLYQSQIQLQQRFQKVTNVYGLIPGHPHPSTKGHRDKL